MDKEIGKVRGKKPVDNPVKILDILLSNKERLFHGGKLRPPRDNIWENIRRTEDVKKSAKALYTFVKSNKYNVKVHLGIAERIEDYCSDYPGNYEVSEEESGEEDNVEHFQQKDQPTSEFDLHIPSEKWKAMEPEERTYHRRNEPTIIRGTRERKYHVLKPGVWTDIFISLIWESIKYPCSWSFKGNYVSNTVDAALWIVARAACACGNRLFISCPNPPPCDPLLYGVDFKVQVWGSSESHWRSDCSTIRKRPFAGEKRRALGDYMLATNKKASKIQQEMASGMMEYGDCYPAHLPSKKVGRRIRLEAVKYRRMDEDPLKSLQLLKYSTHPHYIYAIREIGLDPFFIHIITPNQLKIYNSYCSTSFSRLVVDATGKVVQRLKKPGNTVGQHVFLYLGVIRIPGSGEGLIPVVQMLSERQNSNAIQYWLTEWFRAGAKLPNEVVIDDSAALISGICRLIGEGSAASYIKKCFQYMQGIGGEKPKCLVRIDVAHFTNLIRKWPEVSRLKKRTKEFFMRVIILLAKSTTMLELEELLNFIITVTLSETEGNSLSTGMPTPCELAKKTLIARISGISVTDPDEDRRSRENNTDNGEGDEVADAENVSVPDLKMWYTVIKEGATRNMIDDGDRDNVMHHPEVLRKIERLIYILPLWSGVLPTMLKSPYPQAVGAYVETEISKIKKNLVKRDMRVDDFVKEYLEMCDGVIKIAGSMTPQLQESAQSSANSLKVPGTEKASEQACGDEERNEPPTTCPACIQGSLPEGAHKCALCNRAVHAIDNCSQPLDGEEEGYGQRRICIACSRRENTVGPKHVNSNINERHVGQTSIVERPDISSSNDVHVVEASSVEGWKGLSLPPKKRPQGYYWRPNPDYPVLLAQSSKSKIGVLRNGMDPTLGIIKISGHNVLLTNTCSFDSACQILATAYCDSPSYRLSLDSVNLEDTILGLAVHIAKRGVNAATYKKRVTILFGNLPHQTLRGMTYQVDCSSDCSSLLRRLDIVPSITEVYDCSSPYCTEPYTERKVPVLSAIFDKDTEECLKELHAYLEKGDVGDASICYKELTQLPNISVPTEFLIDDPQISTKGPLCSGVKTRQSLAGPHLIVEIVGSREDLPSDGGELGVREIVNCYLNEIPTELFFKNNSYTLRGVVAFTPPARSTDIGHYRGYARRFDSTWEIYDDLRHKPTIIDGSANVNLHVILYTI